MAKKKRDIAAHVNQVELIGRIAAPVKESANNQFSRVVVIIPGWDKGRKWIKYPITVVGDKRADVKKATYGDFLRCTCFLTEQDIKDDEGNIQKYRTLQMDSYREVGLMSGDMPTDSEPDFDGLCYSRVLLAGRNFIRKNKIEAGQLTPEVRQGNNGSYCYITMRYEDPFQAPPEGDDFYKSMFIDFSINGKIAELAGEWCKNRAQVIVRGELMRRECDYLVKGQKPKEVRVSVMPNGFSFVNLDMSTPKREPTGPVEDNDVNDTSGLILDDDLPF